MNNYEIYYASTKNRVLSAKTMDLHVVINKKKKKKTKNIIMGRNHPYEEKYDEAGVQ